MSTRVHPVSMPLVTEANCHERIAFDDTSRNLPSVLHKLRHAFTHAGKAAYVWRPRPSLRRSFQDRAVTHIYGPMGERQPLWAEYDEMDIVGKPYFYRLDDAIGFSLLYRKGIIKSLSAEYRLEYIRYPKMTVSPALRVNERRIADGSVSDQKFIPDNGRQHYIQMKGDVPRPHYDGQPQAGFISLMRSWLRRDIPVRAVIVDRGGGTILHPDKDTSCITAAGDVLFMELGSKRHISHAMLHEASPARVQPLHSLDINQLRLMRVYDFTLGMR